MARGKYIVIEGPDGTGKTTQADALQAYLRERGIDAIHIKEPGGSPISEAIRGVLLDGTLDRTPMTNILLFTANRHELWHSVIKPALDKGTWVITTRNYWSTLAYQGYGEGMNASIITAITNTFTDRQYMHPDVAVMLMTDDIHLSRTRVGQRGELEKPDPFETRPDEFQQRVRDGYAAIAQEFNIPTIDATQSIGVVTDEIVSLVSVP